MASITGRLRIEVDDLSRPETIALLQEHERSMKEMSPPDSCHVLDADGLRQPGVTFWTIWLGDRLAGCAALKELDAHHAELKSMRTADAFRRQGIASRLLEHLIAEARSRGYRRISLETGSMEFFAPARELYARFGFVDCGPFGSYRLDPYSDFMTLDLAKDDDA